MNIKTSHLTITTFSPDMAQTVYENSQNDDTRRFVPDEVYNSVEEAREAIEFLISRYESTDGPFVYPVITNTEGKNIGYVQLCKVEFEEEETWEIGSDVAIESADAVIVHDNLDAVPYLFKISRKTQGRITFNLCLSMVINFAAVALAISGILNAVWGALFHNCGSVLVVISAFLLLFYKGRD